MSSRHHLLTLSVVGLLLASGFAGTALAGPVVVSGTTAFGATNSPLTVSFVANEEAKLNVDGSAFNGKAIVLETASENLTFTSSGSAAVTVKEGELEGNTNVTDLSVSDSTLTLDPADKSKVDLDGGFSSFAYESSEGSTYSIDYDASSTATLTAYGLNPSADYRITAGGSELANATSDDSGVAAFSLPNGKYTAATLEEYNTGGGNGDNSGSDPDTSTDAGETTTETGETVTDGGTSTGQNGSATDQAPGTADGGGTSTDAAPGSLDGPEGSPQGVASPTGTPTTSGESGPGFGIILTLVTIAVFTALALRSN
jgi:hypothetical protein